MARGSKPGEPGKILSKLTPWERREYLSKIQTRYENGESIRAIAETEGVTFGNVRYWLTKVIGIKLRARKPPPNRTGQRHSEETKRRMSESHKRRIEAQRSSNP